MRRKRPRRERSLDEPGVEVELFDHPDGVHMVVDETDGGFPLGVPYAPIRAETIDDARRRGHGWAIARNALERALRGLAGPGVDVHTERVKYLGRGLCRSAFGARVEVGPERADLAGAYVALLPTRDADPEWSERVGREAVLLDHLHRLERPFRVPRRIAVVEADGPILIEEWVDGIPVDMRAGTYPGVRPWEILGTVAAHVHRIEAPSSMWGHPTRRAHALAVSRELEAYEDPLVTAARDWIARHLPPDAPASLLHGDLLGKNVLVFPDRPPALIDWEYAQLGDPAYDLAIVTRGVRRPFQVDRGLEKLVAAYRAAGGAVNAEEVRLYEIGLVARWLGEALRTRTQHQIDENRHVLRRLFGANK